MPDHLRDDHLRYLFHTEDCEVLDLHVEILPLWYR